MRGVPAGSSDAVGSSSSSTSGSGATARAMHSRCCWPPDRVMATRVQSVLHFVPQGRAASTLARRCRPARAWERILPTRESSRHVVSDGHGGKGGRSLEHHADAAPHLRSGSCPLVDVFAVQQHRARHPPPRHSSCIRFRQRSSVDLPQPDGPMIAVTVLVGEDEGDVAHGGHAAIPGGEPGRSGGSAGQSRARLPALRSEAWAGRRRQGGACPRGLEPG